MKVFIRSAQILDTSSEFHRQKKNVLIVDGKIAEISDNTFDADKIIEAEGSFLSPGWFDMRVSIKDPGYEHKEDIDSICLAAAAGGFTQIACVPNTKPVIHSKDVIAYIKSRASQNLVEIFPIAAVTHNCKGEEMTEMIDLFNSGAVAFSDGEKPVWHSDVLLRSLLYLQTFGGLLIQRAEDIYLNAFGLMNEGKVSTRLGLKGMPKLAEEIMIERDLRVLEYTGGRLHFSQISSPASLELIRNAKKKGIQVTCDIASYHLALDDSLIETFDTSYKVNPPLRTFEDIEYFKKAVADDTIDVIVSAHNPQDEESKNLEFDQAEFGMNNIETSFSVTLQNLNGVSIEKQIEKITVNPRKILGLPAVSVKQGSDANLTLFNTAQTWSPAASSMKSKSKNSPFLGKQLQGRVIGVINKNKIFINQD